MALEVVVAAYTYSVHRSSEPLIVGGKRLAGLRQWGARRILLDADLSPCAAWETLGHEMLEAYEAHLPPPEDKEKRIDWMENIKALINASLNQLGGMDAVSALPAETGLLVAVPITSDDRLKTAKFAHLSYEQFEIAKHLWEKWKLDPWADEFHVQLVPSRDGRQDVKLCLHLPTIRAMAHATGRYAGMDTPVVRYGDDAEIPIAVDFTVYRLADNGERHAFTATAWWHEAFGWDPEKWPDIVNDKPITCLEFRAEVAVLRRAFGLPLYIRDEFRAVAPRRRDPSSTLGSQLPPVDYDDSQIPPEEDAA